MKAKKRRASAREPRVPRRRAVIQTVPRSERGMTPREYVRWMAYALIIGAVVLLPFAVVAGFYHHWVDVPGCKADCAALREEYVSYQSRKSSGICTCIDTFGRSEAFRVNYGLFNDHSLVGGLLDAFVSLGAGLALAAAWYWFLYWLVQRLPPSFWRHDTKPERKA